MAERSRSYRSERITFVRLYRDDLERIVGVLEPLWGPEVNRQLRLRGPSFESQDLADLIESESVQRVEELEIETWRWELRIRVSHKLPLELSCSDYDDPLVRGVYERVKSTVQAARLPLAARILWRVAMHGTGVLTALVSIVFIVRTLEAKQSAAQLWWFLGVILIGAALSLLISALDPDRAMVNFAKRAESRGFWHRNGDMLIVNGIIAIVSLLLGILLGGG